MCFISVFVFDVFNQTEKPGKLMSLVEVPCLLLLFFFFYYLVVETSIVFQPNPTSMNTVKGQ